MGSCDVRPRSATTALLGAVFVWSVVSLMLPRTDASGIAPDPVGIRIGSMNTLAAIASDRPIMRFDIRRAEHPDALPAVVSAAAGTRSPLLLPSGDVRFPMSSIARARLAAHVVRRGPPSASRR